MIRKITLYSALLLLIASTTFAQKMIGNETDAQKEKRMEWWKDARFGMFIHWGLYSEGARHEWLKHNEAMTNEQYQKYFDEFDPDMFDPAKCYAPDSFKVPEGEKLTYNKEAKCLYVHLYDYPSNGKLVLPGYKGKVKYAQFLNDDSELLYTDEGKNDLVLKLPAQKPNYEIPVIDLILQ